ncbi:MAG: polysaccharide pyruvyl transferase family protein [Clostridiales bacterium]|nr:polysaccharide pyruvyl transferase family protein [Clostridiales bacterium]
MKCSIITIHHIHNFGSVFQAYSLRRFLENNGYETDLIDYRPAYFDQGKNKIKTLLGKFVNAKSYCKRKKKFENFIKNNNVMSERTFKSLDDLKAYYGNYSRVFIAGGDQLWNNYHPCGNDDAYKLTFVNNGKKIAYGTSMGRDNFTDDELKSIASKVNDFSDIMLREKVTVPMLAKYVDTNVSHVIDPVALLEVEEFKKIAKKPKTDKPYAVMYLADSSEVLDGAIEMLSKELGLEIVHICGFRKKCYCDKFEKDLGPEEILGYILHADFVLSASFHATMFSVMFEKQFATLLPGTKTNARIEDVLKNFGLEQRIMRSVEDLERIKERVEYSGVSESLESLKRSSIQKLLGALENN